MPCIALPHSPIPSLPGALTLGAEFPDIPDVPVNVCCKIAVFNVPPIPPVSATVIAGAVAGVNAAIQRINDFLDSLEVRCPREA